MYYASGERVNIIYKNTKYVVANMLNINYLVMHNYCTKQATTNYICISDNIVSSHYVRFTHSCCCSGLAGIGVLKCCSEVVGIQIYCFLLVQRLITGGIIAWSSWGEEK